VAESRHPRPQVDGNAFRRGFNPNAAVLQAEELSQKNGQIGGHASISAMPA
jgi:hypothetical protein